MDFSGNAANGRLDAETDWLIQRIELEELDEFAKNSLAEQVDLPVDTAINLLQDKDGNIELNIPISGQLDDPNFGISGVVSKAIGNAISGAVVTTLKVLFPIALLGDISKDDGGVDFEPVIFEDGDATLDSKAQEYVGSVATLMNDRPKLSILVCGVATREDLAVLRRPAHEIALLEAAVAHEQAVADAVALGQPTPPAPTMPDIMASSIAEDEHARLTILADSRQTAVKQMITAEFGIAPDRLFECRDRVETDVDSAPRVEIGI